MKNKNGAETSSLVLSLDNKLAVGGELTGTGWLLPEDLTEEQWDAAGDLLAKVEQSKQWWLGDWWNAGQQDGWGDGKEACERHEFNYETARKAGKVCSAFQLCRRRHNLTFSHHDEVCAIDDPAVQDRMLDWCEETTADTGKPRSTRDLREQVRAYLDDQGWTEEERARRRECEDDNLAITANQKTDERLLRWAQFEGRLAKIDRATDWGNPFELGKDGDRDYCCDCYARYLTMKKSLVKRLPELKGKVLACWCYPERCHGDHLAELANKKGK